MRKKESVVMGHRYEIVSEMKEILKFMDNKDTHVKELESYPPEKQREIYELLTQEMESLLSFQITMEQIKKDKNTAFGNLHS